MISICSLIDDNETDNVKRDFIDTWRQYYDQLSCIINDIYLPHLIRLWYLIHVKTLPNDADLSTSSHSRKCSDVKAAGHASARISNNRTRSNTRITLHFLKFNGGRSACRYRISPAQLNLLRRSPCCEK